MIVVGRLAQPERFGQGVFGRCNLPSLKQGVAEGIPGLRFTGDIFLYLGRFDRFFQQCNRRPRILLQAPDPRVLNEKLSP